MLSRLITASDFLGKTHTPTFKGTSRVKTVLGGIMSVLFCCLVSVGIFFLGRELFEKQNPLSNVSQARESENEIKLDDLGVAFEISTDRGMLLATNPEFLKAVRLDVFTFRVENRGGVYIPVKETIPVQLCTASFLSPEIFNQMKENGVPIEMSFCLDHKNAVDSEGKSIDTVFIKNPKGSANSRQLAIIIERCDSEQHPGCDDFLKKISVLHLNVYLQSQFVDISNYSTPIKQTFDTFYQKVVLDQMRSTYVTYMINELKTDSGFIFNDTETELYYNIRGTTEEFENYSERNRQMGRVFLDVSSMRNIVSRKYMKVQELLASVGGFIKAMLIILSTFLRTYSECTLVNRIRAEENVIERKVAFDERMKSYSNINNYVQNTTATNLNKPVNQASPKHIGLGKYIKVLFGFGSKIDSLDVKGPLAYFDVRMAIKTKQRIDQVELNLKKFQERLDQLN